MRANVSGIELNEVQYAEYRRLDHLIQNSTVLPGQDTSSVEGELQRSVIDCPDSPLRPLLWMMLQHRQDAFSAKLAAQALVLQLTENTIYPVTPYSALHEFLRLSPEGIREVQALLPQHLTDVSDERRAALEDALTQLKALQTIEEEGQAADADAWIEGWLRRVRASYYTHYRTSKDLEVPDTIRLTVLRKMLALNPEEHRPGEDAGEYERGSFWNSWLLGMQAVLTPLLSQELPIDERHAVLDRLVEREGHPLERLDYPQDTFDRAVYRQVSAERETAGLTAFALAAVRRTLLKAYRPSPELKWVHALTTPELNPGEAWADAFLARLDALSPEGRTPWPALSAFARTATSGKPSAKWLGEAGKHVDAVGPDTLREVLTASLPLLPRPRSFRLEPAFYGPDPNLVLDEFNAQSLKGLLWMAPLVADAALARAVAGTVDSALKKVPGVGPRAPKVANAAVYALSQMESDAALSALARLATTVTFKGTLKEVQKGLDAVAARLNVSKDDLLELGVPTLGMQSVGERRETLGEIEACLTVDAGGAALKFSKGGKALKSVPASVKKDFADEWKELKAAQKEAEQAVSALAQRLDSLMIEPRVWRGEQWQERYLHHPLAGTVARRLIWQVEGTPTFYDSGELRDVEGQPVPLPPEAEVKLWHPIGCGVEEVLAWRGRLEALGVRQPFKQAWREVYVLTDAERRTGTYSNRFAGHVLKQHQFHGLAALRGWRNRLRLMVDDSYPPAMRDLPAYGLRAEYWIEGIGENYGEDTNESGSFLRVSTDQVRFYPLNAPENHAHAGGGGYTMWVNQTQQPAAPLALEQIPPLVLSEILRDVDLFVGVASVGNDPTWQDGGPGGRFREYWQSYSFGELTETAKTRAEYLRRLIPRLKIAERLSLEGRFLRVRGDRRTYKIHLGSGNILMEPNDQYLCIIPGGRGDGPDVEFDGDRVLSLILSKALLLADDTRITDPVILQQLGR